MTHPGRENFDGSAGSVNWKPSLATLRSMSENMCCAVASRPPSSAAGRTVRCGRDRWAGIATRAVVCARAKVVGVSRVSVMSAPLARVW
jgi:hypothetical protein